MLTHGVDKDDAMALTNVDADVVLTIGEGSSELPPAQDAPTVWSLPGKANDSGNDTASTLYTVLRYVSLAAIVRNGTFHVFPPLFSTSICKTRLHFSRERLKILT